MASEDRFKKNVTYAHVRKQHVPEVFRRFHRLKIDRFVKPAMLKLVEKSNGLRKIIYSVREIECKKDVSNNNKVEEQLTLQPYKFSSQQEHMKKNNRYYQNESSKK